MNRMAIECVNTMFGNKWGASGSLNTSQNDDQRFICLGPGFRLEGEVLCELLNFEGGFRGILGSIGEHARYRLVPVSSRSDHSEPRY